MVSLGDLGESKDCTGSGSLFAGTTECFKLAPHHVETWPVSIDAAQPAPWPRLAEAPETLEHGLALREASGGPAGEVRARFLFHTGARLP